ncbi:osteocrin [Girardinichthys multiradiatus]|uniref:osteocrin n=1 Tax=Girardinichthys multiradiatus TaxID=208333 RepID=UPI001FAB7D3D|nr:osteocrin [Girardinichthys multiradiatus]
MQFCSYLLIFCLLSITVLHCSVHGFQQRPAKHIVQPGLRTLVMLPHHPGGMKLREELTAKFLRTDDLKMMENDVTEPKRKKSFPGNNAPLDRLSMSSMETRPGRKKQSKVVESPRRRENPPPIDRVGMSRLPTTRG